MGAFAGVDTTRLLVTAMRVATTTHTVIANNIANVDTPRYNPVQIDFLGTLRNELEGRGRISLRKSRPQHLETSRFRPQTGNLVIQSKNDYNKVDIDQEMANLSKNTGRYTVYGSLLVKQFQVIKSMLSNQR